MSGCVRVCVCVRSFACMCVRVYVCMYVRMSSACTSVCNVRHMHACIYLIKNACTKPHIHRIQKLRDKLKKPSCAQRVHIYTTIMELGPQDHNKDGPLGPNSIMAVCMDPLGWCSECLKQLSESCIDRSKSASRCNSFACFSWQIAVETRKLVFFWVYCKV